MAKEVFRYIRQKVKFVIDLVASEGVKANILQALPFWFASIVTGLVAVAYALLFSYAERLSHFLFSSYHWLVFIVTPFCFFIAWWIVKKFAPSARGSGIPQVMAAIDLTMPKKAGVIGKLLSLRIIIVKVLSSLMMVLGGAAVGREGPTIQIAGSVFWKINQLIPASWPKLAKGNFIMTGAAAGLAAAFNTPLGGVVFAMEELAKVHVRFFRTALFTAVIIAGLTAQAILGPYLYLGYPNVSGLRFSVFFGVALTALIGGVCGAIMCKLILRVMKWRATFTDKRIPVFVIGAGLLIAVVAFFLSEKVMGSGKELMTNVLFTNQKQEDWFTPLLRIGGIIVSFCTGAAGGVFAPSLSAGASIGAVLSDLFEISGSNANILILSGMVSFLTGVTRAPFTSAILVLEMTDRHSVIFHLMLAAMLSNVAALLIDKHSLYDHLKKQYIEEARIDSLPPPEKR